MLAALLLASTLQAAPPLPPAGAVSLSKEPRLGTGELSQLLGAAPPLAVKVGARAEAVYLSVKVEDAQRTPGDRLALRLHFPSAGPAARGYVYNFGVDGKRAADPETGAPAFADALVRSELHTRAEGFVLEAKVPVRGLPRFPARGPLLLEACATYEDQDAVGEKPQRTSSCEGTSAIQLPESLRKQLKLSVPPDVEGVEARRDGWVGFGSLRLPSWAWSDKPLSPAVLAGLVAEDAVSPRDAELPLEDTVRLHDGRLAYLVLSGKNPYRGDESCDSDRELRLALYVLEGRAARRVLEWPAATCPLGRALSVVIDDDGSLTIGYSGGSTTHFAWSRDHFERTEFGKR